MKKKTKFIINLSNGSSRHTAHQFVISKEIIFVFKYFKLNVFIRKKIFSTIQHLSTEYSQLFGLDIRFHDLITCVKGTVADK